MQIFAFGINFDSFIPNISFTVIVRIAFSRLIELVEELPSSHNITLFAVMWVFIHFSILSYFARSLYRLFKLKHGHKACFASPLNFFLCYSQILHLHIVNNCHGVRDGL